MTRNNFLLVATVVAAVFGLAFLLAPSQLVALYGVTLTPSKAWETFVSAQIGPQANRWIGQNRGGLPAESCRTIGDHCELAVRL